MSTRSSLYTTNNGVHIYHELLDGYVYADMEPLYNVRLMSYNEFSDMIRSLRVYDNATNVFRSTEQES